ncbi:hypothetical protein D3C72_1820410 [compost metagenome]
MLAVESCSDSSAVFCATAEILSLILLRPLARDFEKIKAKIIPNKTPAETVAILMVKPLAAASLASVVLCPITSL